MPVKYHLEGNVAVFTIDNGKLNLFTMEMHEQFYRSYLQFMDDDNAKVAVLTGAGENFSAGDDLKESDTEIKSRKNLRWDELLLNQRRTKPMISAINGWCLGQGIVYSLLLTDIRIAGTSARLGFPEIAYGMGGISGATRLGIQIPAVHAAYLALTGEKINAQQAKEYFLVNEVTSDGECFSRAMEIANQIARHPLIAIKTELDGLHRGTELSRSGALQHATEQYINQRKWHLAAGHSAVEDLKNRSSSEKGKK
ncbi:hypothetical protein CMT41_10325 [Colwellia sp. MT41]|uniref:Enoyl-CoA hydratase n=1 Tax=Colwellia marinimaniae TaxID=1513592 RepID=A0ABQ0MS25_9GAMM|nr:MULTISPECIES: enoyl-CoA hydratase/isomerase family protein [Colwellia]ALO35068.1 hypothetical protein CMT41_10325 [Colwellia sp. MT41]GAW95162.1 enoyl-CoA hydratase [Colwellia marinimaniae]